MEGGQAFNQTHGIFLRLEKRSKKDTVASQETDSLLEMRWNGQKKSGIAHQSTKEERFNKKDLHFVSGVLISQ